MTWPYRIVAILVIALPCSPLIAGEKEDPSLLTVQRIFGGPEFEPEHLSVRWLGDSSGYATLEPSTGPAGGRDLVRHDPETGKQDVLVPAAHLIPPGETAPLAIDDYALSPDRCRLLIFTNSKRVWRTNSRGDYWVLDRGSRELRKLGGDAPPASLMHAKFAPGGSQVAYVRANNLYVEDLREGRITRLTSSSSPEEINGTFDWVYEEEFGLRDGFRWSPDGRSIAYWQLNTEGVREFPLVNSTDSLYPRINPIKYPKVGEQNAACRVGVVSSRGGDTRWLDVAGDPRNHYIAFVEWAGNSQEVVLQQLNRLQDTVRVMLADVRTGKVKTILTEHDAAWVDLQDELPWIHDDREFLWLSERDGWRHLYRAGRTGGELTLITPGDFDVIQLVAIDRGSDWVYFLASPDNPTQRHLYRVHLDGTGRERVSPAAQSGTHDYQPSPDARWAIHRFSAFETIPRTALIGLATHGQVRLISDNKALAGKVESLKKGRADFFRVDIGEGIALDAWCMLPPGFDSTAKYPLLVHVYGEPAAQSVLDRWGGGNHLWHRMLAQNGYIVMSFDNRGTPAPRGRAWRKAVYHQIGVLAPKDQAAAVKEVLRKRPYIDGERVGIWGWSGGGSMSLNAVFKYPEIYKTAIAVAPVSNQRYYDTIYQERYMGLPGDNVEGFIQGSPINFAHQLKGNLLLIHGTGDDNCHYQGTEALINELIRHNKPFQMMAYPNRSHGIYEGQNTTLHLRELMTRYLKENLPTGPIRTEHKGRTTGSEK
ncbi:MAG: S9 family peptidase [Isosphaerales bacterium]